MYFGLLVLLIPEHDALLCASSLNHSLISRISAQRKGRLVRLHGRSAEIRKHEWKDREERLRKKEVAYLEEQTREGEKDFEEIMRTEREMVEAVLARGMENFRAKEEGMAKAELEKRAQAAKGKLLEKLKDRMEEHRENRE